MSAALHALAAKLDDSRSSLASYARVIDDLWRKGMEPAPTTRAQLAAEVARFEALGAEMDTLVESEQAQQKGMANAG